MPTLLYQGAFEVRKNTTLEVLNVFSKFPAVPVIRPLELKLNEIRITPKRVFHSHPPQRRQTLDELFASEADPTIGRESCIQDSAFTSL